MLSQTDSLPKIWGKCAKNWKKLGFFWKIFKKNIPYWRFELFHIGGNLFNKIFGLQQKYSVLEVYSVWEYSVLEFLLYYDTTVTLMCIGSQTYFSVHSSIEKGLQKSSQQLTSLYIFHNSHILSTMVPHISNSQLLNLRYFSQPLRSTAFFPKMCPL